MKCPQIPKCQSHHSLLLVQARTRQEPEGPSLVLLATPKRSTEAVTASLHPCPHPGSCHHHHLLGLTALPVAALAPTVFSPQSSQRDPAKSKSGLSLLPSPTYSQLPTSLEGKSALTWVDNAEHNLTPNLPSGLELSSSHSPPPSPSLFFLAA